MVDTFGGHLGRNRLIFAERMSFVTDSDASENGCVTRGSFDEASGAPSTQIRLKSSDQTFFGTVPDVSENGCLTTVV